MLQHNCFLGQIVRNVGGFRTPMSSERKCICLRDLRPKFKCDFLNSFLKFLFQDGKIQKKKIEFSDNQKVSAS